MFMTPRPPGWHPAAFRPRMDSTQPKSSAFAGGTVGATAVQTWWSRWALAWELGFQPLTSPKRNGLDKSD